MAPVTSIATILILLNSFLVGAVNAGHELKAEIPSDGTKFYKDYLVKSMPIFYHKAAIHWPAARLWRDLTYVEKTFSNENLTVRFKLDGDPFIESMTLYQTLTDCRKLKLSCSYSASSNSFRILHDVYLPSVLQCRDVNKHLEIIEFKSDFTNRVPLFTAASDDMILGVISGKKRVQLLNTSAMLTSNNVELMKFLNLSGEEQNKEVTESLDQFLINVTLKTGDVLFIPQHWLYQVHQLSEKHNVDVYISIGLLPDPQSSEQMMRSPSDFAQNVRKFQQLRRSLPPTVPCAENAIPLNEGLRISEDEKDTLHLRIPKRRKRPDDVLLASGYKLPPIGFGTALLNEKTIEAVKTALSNGFRLFDMAQAYGEKGTAAAIREYGIPRSEVFLITKLHPKSLGFQTTLDSIKKSMEDLETDYLDVFLIHSQICDDFLLKCNENEPNGTWQESWKAMEEAQRLGWVRSIGVSNFDLKSMKELVTLATVPVSVLQNWFDPMHQDTELREFCKKHGISYQGYSTLGSQWKHSFGLSYNPVLTSDLILNIAAHYDYVASHVVLRYAIHKGVTPITSSADPNHIAQSFRSLDISLHSLEIEAIDQFDDAMTEALRDIEDFSADGATSDSESSSSSEVHDGDHETDSNGDADNKTSEESPVEESKSVNDESSRDGKTAGGSSSNIEPRLTDEDEQNTLKTEL